MSLDIQELPIKLEVGQSERQARRLNKFEFVGDWAFFNGAETAIWNLLEEAADFD